MTDSPLQPPDADPFPLDGHDHNRCVDAAVTHATTLCAQRGVRLTAGRRRVLELVWRSHAPMGAYEILEILGRERGRLAPPTVYRALEFLVEHGVVHRIDTLNAFVGCSRPESRHEALFLICRGCRVAVEIEDNGLQRAMREVTAGARFAVERATVEIAGLCGTCRHAGVGSQRPAAIDG